MVGTMILQVSPQHGLARALVSSATLLIYDDCSERRRILKTVRNTIMRGYWAAIGDRQ